MFNWFKNNILIQLIKVSAECRKLRNRCEVLSRSNESLRKQLSPRNEASYVVTEYNMVTIHKEAYIPANNEHEYNLILEEHKQQLCSQAMPCVRVDYENICNGMHKIRLRLDVVDYNSENIKEEILG